MNLSLYDRYFDKGVPDRIKTISEIIMLRFRIDGECDGMYLANAIARINGIGDGMGRFTGTVVSEPERTARYLMESYGCNIDPEDLPELVEILKNGYLNIPTARKGIERFIKKKEEERDWRSKVFLPSEIKKAKSLLSDLRLRWSERERETILDRGWTISPEDGRIHLTKKQFDTYQYHDRSVSDSHTRTLMLPTDHGCTLIFENRHFVIDEDVKKLADQCNMPVA